MVNFHFMPTLNLSKWWPNFHFQVNSPFKHKYFLNAVECRCGVWRQLLTSGRDCAHPLCSGGNWLWVQLNADRQLSLNRYTVRDWSKAKASSSTPTPTSPAQRITHHRFSPQLYHTITRIQRAKETDTENQSEVHKYFYSKALKYFK